MSLHVPGVPKNACHIHKSYDATTSKIIVGLPLLPAYCPAQAVGQFFHSQCIPFLWDNFIKIFFNKIYMRMFKKKKN
ncbi:hypothetical protein Hanom_Chr12g01159581 [Helianthus anomalus]